MAPSKRFGGLFFASISLCLLLAIAFLSVNILNNKACAINTRGVVSYKEVLSEQEKVNYESCLECYNEYGNEFEVNVENVEDFDEEWKKLNKFVTYDNPIHSIRKANLSENQIKLIKDNQNFYIKISNEESYDYEDVYKFTISKLDFLNKEFSEKYITDREYIENIYLFLKEMISYDHTYKNNNIYEAAINNSSACLGQSSVLKYLLDKNMIPNFIAEGYLGDQLHSWNEVYLEGEWYLLDLTSDIKELQTLTERNQIYNEAYELSEITKSLIGYYKIEL